MTPDLRLIYVLKIGYNSKGEGLYEFLFSKDPSAIDSEGWGWEEVPASMNATPPSAESVDKILSLQTKKLDLKCLHEANDRSYMDGYYTIHCLAHEDTESENSDMMYDELPLLVFHYGMKLEEIQDKLYSRDIQFKEITPDKSQALASDEEEEEEEEEFDI